MFPIVALIKAGDELRAASNAEADKVSFTDVTGLHTPMERTTPTASNPALPAIPVGHSWKFCWHGTVALQPLGPYMH